VERELRRKGICVRERKKGPRRRESVEEDEVASTRIITDKIRLMAIQKFNDF
jgi:hypothetical protein